MVTVASTTKDEAYMSSVEEYDKEVLRRINGYIDTAAWKLPSGTIEEILDEAQGSSVNDREKWGDDNYTADVSYYLQARYNIAKRKHWYSKITFSEGGIVLTYFYNMIKLVANPVQRHYGLHFLESHKGRPNTPATLSSVRWVKRGAYDGYRDCGSLVGKPVVPTSWPYSFTFGT